MATGTTKGPKMRNGDYRTRRNGLPRISSVEGIEARMDRRATTMPGGPKAGEGAYHKPGSRNRKKVGRG